MESIGLWCIIIGLILIAMSYFYHQALEARVRVSEVKMQDEMMKVASTQNAANMHGDAIRDMRLKMKDLRDEYEKDSEAVEFISQEIIRMDRELSKLRPVIKLMLPKEVLSEKKKSKRTAH